MIVYASTVTSPGRHQLVMKSGSSAVHARNGLTYCVQAMKRPTRSIHATFVKLSQLLSDLRRAIPQLNDHNFFDPLYPKWWGKADQSVISEKRIWPKV